jgi:hypothetical protein
VLTNDFCVSPFGAFIPSRHADGSNAEQFTHRLGSAAALDVLPARPLPLPVPLALPLPLPRPLGAGLATSVSLDASAATAASSAASIRLPFPSAVTAALAFSAPACTCTFLHRPQVPARFCKTSRLGFAQVSPVRVDLTHKGGDHAAVAVGEAVGCEVTHCGWWLLCLLVCWCFLLLIVADTWLRVMEWPLWSGGSSGLLGVRLGRRSSAVAKLSQVAGNGAEWCCLWTTSCRIC